MKKETRRISEVEEEKKQANRLAIVNEKYYAEFGLTKAAVKKYILMQIAKAKG